MNNAESRHDRQRLLAWLGDSGQQQLRAAHALVVGCGALGSVEAELLVRAGVGMLTIVDRDVVEWSNLQRQSLFDERDAAERRPKAEAAKRRLQEIDSSVRIHACVEQLDAESVADLARGATVIVDGLDNAPARYLLNDFAVRGGVSFVHAAAVGMDGRSLAITPGRPCLRCIFPDAPAPGSIGTCDTVGVFGPVVSMTGAFAAAQAIRVLAGRIDLVSAGLWATDLARGRTVTFGAELVPDSACVCCAQRRFEWLDGPSDSAAVLCGRNAVQIAPSARPGPRGVVAIDFDLMRQRLAPHGTFAQSGATLRGTLHAIHAPSGGLVEVTLFSDGRAIIEGSSDPLFARTVYDRLVGL